MLKASSRPKGAGNRSASRSASGGTVRRRPSRRTAQAADPEADCVAGIEPADRVRGDDADQAGREPAVGHDRYPGPARPGIERELTVDDVVVAAEVAEVRAAGDGGSGEGLVEKVRNAGDCDVTAADELFRLAPDLGPGDRGAEVWCGNGAPERGEALSVPVRDPDLGDVVLAEQVVDHRPGHHPGAEDSDLHLSLLRTAA